MKPLFDLLMKKTEERVAELEKESSPRTSKESCPSDFRWSSPLRCLRQSMDQRRSSLRADHVHAAWAKSTAWS
jgi:hypothetical protein